MFLEGKDNILYNIAIRIFYVFIATFPFIIYHGALFSGTATRSINLVVFVEILLVISAIILFKKKSTFSVIKSPISLVLGIFFLVSFVASFFGADFSVSFWSKATRMTGLFYLLHLAFFYLLAVGFLRQDRVFKNFLNIFLISAAIFSVFSLMSGDGFGLIFKSKLWTGFTIGNSTFAAMLIYVAFLLSIYWVVSHRREIRKWWYYVVPFIYLINPYIINRDLWLGRINIFKNPFSIIGEAQATSFTVIISVVLLAIIFFILRLKNIKTQKIMILGGTIFGLITLSLVFSSFLSQNGYIQEKFQAISSPARPIVWNIAREAVADRPLLGWGVDNFDLAFNTHFDNRLLIDETGSENWFDRAHNIFWDQLVETGYLGLISYLLIYLVLLGTMIYVLLFSTVSNDKYLSAILITYTIGHFLELQTAFDTSISYIPVIIMVAIAAVLFQRTYSAKTGRLHIWLCSENVCYTLGAVFIGLSVFLFYIGTWPIIKAEAANNYIRTIGSSAERLPYYDAIFDSPLDTATFLWRTTTDFQRGIAMDLSILNNPNKVEGLKQELQVFADKYEEYLLKHPNDYRSYLGLANVLIYQRLFDIDHLSRAQEILDRAVILSPKNENAYWMKSVAYLYMRKFDLAREWAQKAKDVNPAVERSQRVIDYIGSSIEAFPEIDLFNFW